MSFFQMHFALPLAATAAGLKHDTASKWIGRGELVMKPQDREKIGRGGGVILSALTTLQLIVAGELTRRGLKVSDACEAALQFAHWGQVKGEMGAKRDRKPGHLFPDGLTLLCIDRTEPDQSKVRHYTGAEKLGGTFMSHGFDAVELKTLLYLKLGGLGIDVHAAMTEIQS